MIHHRQGFERVYDFRERIAPPEWNYAATEQEAEHYFARKIIAFHGLVTEREWANWFSGHIGRKLERAEARQRLQKIREQGELAAMEVEGSKGSWFVLSTDVPILLALKARHIPEVWQPLTTSTEDEAVFLAPLDIVSTRGRASWLFDFEYLWEVYKPVEKRRWGYYTLPILYGDRLVARLDPKLDRASNTLLINGFWLEEHAPAESAEFATALARGLERFAGFVNAPQVDIRVLEPPALRNRVREHIGSVPFIV